MPVKLPTQNNVTSPNAHSCKHEQTSRSGAACNPLLDPPISLTPTGPLFFGHPHPQRHPCWQTFPLCGDPVDIFCDHAVACDEGKKFRRQFAIQDWLLQLLRSHGIACAREHMLDPDTRLRPADIFIPNWSVEGYMALDVTARQPLPPLLFPASTSSANDLSHI